MPDFSFQGIKDAFASLLGQSKGDDAVSMLVEDHKRVKTIFDTFKDLEDDEKMQAIRKALIELALHAACEEKIIYPIMKDDEKDEVDEAFEEHHVMKTLMKELAGMTSSSDRLDAKFKVLGEIVQHHVEEEEKEMFPQLRSKEGVDLHELGEQIAAKKEELLAKLGDDKELGLIDPELMNHRNGNDLAPESENGTGKRKDSHKGESRKRAGAAARRSGATTAATSHKRQTGKPAAKTGAAKKATAPARKTESQKKAPTAAKKSSAVNKTTASGKKGGKQKESTVSAKKASGAKSVAMKKTSASKTGAKKAVEKKGASNKLVKAKKSTSSKKSSR